MRGIRCGTHSTGRWWAPVAGAAAAGLPFAVVLSWTPGSATGAAEDVLGVETVAEGGPAAWAFREESGEGADDDRSSRPAATAAGPPLLMPVTGVHHSELRNSFGHRRGEERRHVGIDIFAPSGTAVLAATDGWIWRMTWNRAGGRTLHLLDGSRAYLLYYAHLEAYAPDIEEGRFVRAGEVIGRVGSTGNVVGGAHLHFEVHRIRSPERWWDGRPVNPHELLAP